MTRPCLDEQLKYEASPDPIRQLLKGVGIHGVTDADR